MAGIGAVQPLSMAGLRPDNLLKSTKIVAQIP
jgi:hypothetical protein